MERELELASEESRKMVEELREKDMQIKSLRSVRRICVNLWSVQNEPYVISLYFRRH